MAAPRKVTERARVHRPMCVLQRGECGCPLDLIPQPPRFFIGEGVTEEEVDEARYNRELAAYRRRMGQ